MEPVASFFASNMIAVYFLYGLAFFALGLAVIVGSGRAAPSPWQRVMALLGPFGVVYGAGERASYDGLTDREREVLKLIAEGHTNQVIADQLVISSKTVERHRANIMDKLNLHSRTELVKYAIRKGLIGVD